MGARALFRGRQHVCAAVNDEFLEIAGDVVGVPAREAFIDEESRRCQVGMDAVFADGIARTVAVVTSGVAGVVTIVPVIRQGRVWGLVTDWSACAPLPTPASRGSDPTVGAGRSD